MAASSAAAAAASTGRRHGVDMQSVTVLGDVSCGDVLLLVESRRDRRTGDGGGVPRCNRRSGVQDAGSPRRHRCRRRPTMKRRGRTGPARQLDQAGRLRVGRILVRVRRDEEAEAVGGVEAEVDAPSLVHLLIPPACPATIPATIAAQTLKIILKS